MTQSSDLPPGLKDFGDRLRDAADAQIEREQAARRSEYRHGRRRALLGALAAIAVPAGAFAVAGALNDDAGAPRPADPDLPKSIRPAPDPTVVQKSAVPDPDGGLPWALKVFNNPGGEQCVAVGRLRDGRIGQIERQRFHAYPLRINGVCGDPARSGLLFAVERRAEPAPRTVIYGLSAGREPVVLNLAGERLRVPPGALGSFIFVVRGRRELDNAKLTTSVGSRHIAVKLG